MDIIYQKEEIEDAYQKWSKESQEDWDNRIYSYGYRKLENGDYINENDKYEEN